MSTPRDRQQTLGTALSGRLSSSLLDPQLRSALLGSRAGASSSILPPAVRVLSADQAAMFRSLRQRAAQQQQQQGPSKSEGAAPGQGPPSIEDLDSAMFTEGSERAGSVASESSLLALLDEGWFSHPPPRRPSSARSAPIFRVQPAGSEGSVSGATGAGTTSQALPAATPQRSSPSPLELPEGEPSAMYAESSGSPASAFASWSPAGGAGPSARPSSATGNRAAAAATAAAAAASSLVTSVTCDTPAAESVAGSGWESPRSWSTHISQVQLESMELAQLEQLAAEAAALQQRAALAMSFARQRMGAPTAMGPPTPAPAAGTAAAGGGAGASRSGSGPSVAGESRGKQPAAGGVAAAATQLLPRLALLALSLGEVLLLLWVGLLASAASLAAGWAGAAPAALARWAAELVALGWGLLLAAIRAAQGRVP